MKTLISTALLLITFNLFGQEEGRRASGDLSPWSKMDDSNPAPIIAYTLVTDANLREKPDANAKIVQKLAIATKITISEVDKTESTLNGFKAPWCKVSLANGTSGYLWGGILSCATFIYDQEYDDEKGLMILAGVSSFEEKTGKTVVQIRAVKNGVELSKTEFSAQADVGYYLDIIHNDCKVFENVNSVFEVDLYYPACGYASSENLYFFSKNKFIKAMTTSSVSDAGAFFAVESVLLPCDKGGIANHIMLIKNEGEYDENINGEPKLKTQSYNIELFKWTGDKLIKVKSWK